MSNEPKDLNDILAECRVTLDGQDTDPEFVLKYQDIGIFPRGDVVAIKGKAKAGKSHFLALLTAAILKGEYGGFTAVSEGLKVVWMDTEQGIRNSRSLFRKVIQMANVEAETTRFQMFNLRSLTPQDRLASMTLLSGKYRPDVFIIDGIRDLMTDPNDQKEAFPVVGEMMRISKVNNCVILTVLHQNKKDDNMIGHAGSELQKKAAEVYQVSKDADGLDAYFRVNQPDSRNTPAPDFCFRLQEDGIPFSTEIALQSKAMIQQAKIIGNLDKIIEPGTGLAYSDLLAKYLTVATCSESTAKRHINIAVSDGILLKEPNGIYNRRIYVQSASF